MRRTIAGMTSTHRRSPGSLPGASLAFALCASTGAACMGSIGDGGPGGPAAVGLPGPGGGPGSGMDADAGGPTVSGSDGPTAFSCNTSLKGTVDGLRALTTAQYTNTVSDLVSWALGDATAGATVLSEVSSAMASLPGNVPIVPLNSTSYSTIFPDGGWLRADQDQQITRVQAFYGIGAAVGQALVTTGRIGKLVGSCATDGDASNDVSCLASFIARFAPRALRRPITSDDVTFLTGVYGTDPTADPAAYADVVAVILNMPDFLYFVEHGDQSASATGVYTLSATELASRLSYHVWDTLPDDELWSHALDGTLLEDAVYQKQVDRLFADPRARAAMDRFFADYMQVNDSGGPRGTGGLNYHNLALRVADPVFKAFAGSDLPTPALVQDMVADALGLLDYYTWTQPGTIHDLLTTPYAFAQTGDVAAIYGLPAWDGTSPPPAFPKDERPGLFTRALFVAAGTDTSPILKGVYLRRYVLCDTLGRPPAAAANAMIVLSPTQTTRQVTEQITSVSPCNGCHTPYINPLGFATEDFDGLGRHRTQQTLFNPDSTVAAMLPVDTSGVPHVRMADGKTTASGVADVMSQIDASNKAGACLTRNYFRYTFGRFEDLAADGCALEQVRSKLDQGGHIVDMLRAIVLTPAFKQRTFQ
jgi:hypothetical protein